MYKVQTSLEDSYSKLLLEFCGVSVVEAAAKWPCKPVWKRFIESVQNVVRMTMTCSDEEKQGVDDLRSIFPGVTEEQARRMSQTLLGAFWGQLGMCAR